MALINCKYIWVAQRKENTEELIKNNISIVSYLFNSYGYEYSYYYLLPYEYCDVNLIKIPMKTLTFTIAPQ